MTSQYSFNPPFFYKSAQSQSSACLLSTHEPNFHSQNDSLPHESKTLNHMFFQWVFVPILNDSKNLMPLKQKDMESPKLHEKEMKLTIKSQSSEENIDKPKCEKKLPNLTLSRSESDNMLIKSTGRPKFVNSKLKPKSKEKTIEDIKELLENIPKNCPQETMKIFTEFIQKGNENIKQFVDAMILKAIKVEKRYQSSTFAEILQSLTNSDTKPTDNNHYTIVLKRCLLRKIQDIFEDQSVLLKDKFEKYAANELEKSLHKLLFLDFIKALYRVGILNLCHIKNSLLLLIVIFFNDNAKICKSLEKNERIKNDSLKFKMDFTLELILTFLTILFKSTNFKSHEENIEKIKKEKYQFYEDFFCQAHEEQLIHNFSKDLLKIFNIFKENYQVSWLVIKEIFTVNNDYLIIMENDTQKLRSRKYNLLEQIDPLDHEKNH